MVDHAYVADMGGTVYRIDFSHPSTLDPLASTAWTMTTVAQTNATNVGRKFLFPPAVLPVTVGGVAKVILTLGSGDRERPLSTNYPYVTPVPNRFYAFTDTPTPATDPQPAILNLDNTDSTAGDVLADLTASNINSDPDLTTCLPTIRGWRMDLVGGTVGGVSEPNGEQVVTSSLISGGRVFFNTHQALTPSANTCDADLGRARGYSVDLFCGGKYSVIYEGGGLAISPVQGTVTTSDGETVTFIIGGPGGPGSTNPYTPGQIKPVIAPIRSLLYWYRQGDK